MDPYSDTIGPMWAIGANGVLLSIEAYQGSKKGLLKAYSRAYILCRTNCST